MSTEQYIVSKNNLDKTKHKWDRFHLFQPFISCPPGRPLRRVGPEGDGGKWLCEPAVLKEPCTVVSMGSNMAFGFEEAILNETPCQVVTLDCTVEGKKLSDRHTFHRLCVGSSALANVDTTFVTYRQFVSALGLQEIPVLKIDVESFEFPLFGEWREHSRSLPEQIAVEVHLHERRLNHSELELRSHWGRGEFGVMDLALFFSHLANLGYGIVSQEMNKLCVSCSEFTLQQYSGRHQVSGPYSSTVRLPTTEFSLRANSPIREPQIQQYWEQHATYEALVEGNTGVGWMRFASSPQAVLTIPPYIVSKNNLDKTKHKWDRFRFFQPFISCPPGRPLRRVGPEGDGGKWLCEPAALKEPCTVISMGSNMAFGFEEAILNETRCQVVTLDCTVEGKKLSDRHTFHRLCVGSSALANVDTTFVTYRQFVSALGLQEIPVLKIDVESFEFPLFGEWREHSRSLPEQIAVEVHLREKHLNHSQSELRSHWGRGEFGVMDLALFFSHLANLGYGIVSQEINRLSLYCSEFTLLRVEAAVPYKGGSVVQHR
ncbi:hypothetical protein VOLCADRAFT_97397 [Volvox carteri f. nagariensis]|uniref:Methyltransferase domain-containing protein n=1 Tax=Volvox carteri f. nagariensis TaxID=3068 RepID=D8UCN1_VOLCA|nr:uncharacterized protein VOLCADRAFT_97397 [Volvox carteri f. nagariensis]EFJ42523.1 hypothetical protein VOLCADRAFT_97397 [Volvox carteri f. nagariensis]|eukprot:XP_002956379.1 hypothetical protein VOLCADRAFT_97397 [Volvox carteri f. nagariensis]